MKGITPEICRLCVYVIINKCSFESFMCLDIKQRHAFMVVVIIMMILLVVRKDKCASVYTDIDKCATHRDQFAT